MVVLENEDNFQSNPKSQGTFPFDVFLVIRKVFWHHFRSDFSHPQLIVGGVSQSRLFHDHSEC